jgi:hypothetical protein
LRLVRRVQKEGVKVREETSGQEVWLLGEAVAWVHLSVGKAAVWQ